MIFFLIILVMVALTPYVGSVVLRSLSFNHDGSKPSFENYIVGFSLGQLLLIKVITLLGVFGLINFNIITSTLLLFFIMALALDLRKGWVVAIGYLEIINAYHSARRNKAIWLIIIITFVLGTALLVDLTPPRHADMLRYHLEYSNYILNSGSLSFVPHNQLALATDAELLFSMIIIGAGSGYVKLVVYINLIFCILAAFKCFEPFGPVVRKYATGFFITSPILFLASTIVKPDTIQLLYFVVSLLLLNKLFQKFSFTSLILIAIFLGEVVSLKWTGVIPVLSLTIYLIFLFLIKAENRKTLLYLIVAIGVATIIIPMYWYVRNYLATGNPIWPILNHLFVANDQSLLYEITTHGSSRSGEISKYGFLGYLFYTFFIYKPSLLGGLGVSYYLSLPLAMYKSADKKIIYNFIFVIIYMIVWYFAQASFRHLIWLLPFISVIASYGYVRSKKWKSGVLKYTKKIIILLVLFQLVFIAIYSTFFIKYSIGVVSDDEYYATTPNYHAFKEVEIDINNPVKKVLVIVPGSEIYYLDQPHIDGNSRHSAIIDYKKINSIAALLNKLDELELDFILFDDELIQSEIYNDLRKVIAQSSVIVERYDSEIIKNRLLGKSIMKHLTLVKRIHD
jgi:hypothetical protein